MWEPLVKDTCRQQREIYKSSALLCFFPRFHFLSTRSETVPFVLPVAYPRPAVAVDDFKYDTPLVHRFVASV